MIAKRESPQRAYRTLPSAAIRTVALARWAGVAGAALCAAGCATVTTADGARLGVASDEFAAYAEQVFREQNRVATELAFALEDEGDPARAEALEAAEAALLAACASLNEVAASRRDEGRAGAGAGLRAARETPGCERATLDALQVLESPPASRRPQ